MYIIFFLNAVKLLNTVIFSEFKAQNPRHLLCRIRLLAFSIILISFSILSVTKQKMVRFFLFYQWRAKGFLSGGVANQFINTTTIHTPPLSCPSVYGFIEQRKNYILLLGKLKWSWKLSLTISVKIIPSFIEKFRIRAKDWFLKWKINLFLSVCLPFCISHSPWR